MKLSLNVEESDHADIETIKGEFPFATTHAIALMAFREGLQRLREEPERILARLDRQRTRRP